MVWIVSIVGSTFYDLQQVDNEGVIHRSYTTSVSNGFEETWEMVSLPYKSRPTSIAEPAKIRRAVVEVVDAEWSPLARSAFAPTQQV